MREAAAHRSGYRLAIWLGGFVWIGLAGWCAVLISGISGLRQGVRQNDAWLTEAEALRRDLFTAFSEPRDAAASGLASCLSGRVESVFAARPPVEGRIPALEEMRAAAASISENVLALRSAESGSVETDRLLAAFSEDERVLVLGMSSLVGAVRSRAEVLANELNQSWDSLYVLSAFSLIAVATELLLLVFLSRQAGAQARARIALLESEGRLRSLVQTTQGLIWSMDTEGKWTFVNEAARTIYGIEPEEMIGRSISEFTAPQRSSTDLEIIREVLVTETPRNFETVHQREDGRPIHMLFNATATRDADGTPVGVTGTATDVTAIHEMRKNLFHNERLQAIGTLAGGVAHDFGNLLTGIVGQGELAKRSLGNPARVERHLNKLLSTSERASLLIHQLLTFARRQQVEKEMLDLCTVVRDTDSLLRQIIGRKIELTTETPSEPVYVFADRIQLEQVLLSVIVNCRDAMPQGGVVRLFVERHTAPAKSGEHPDLLSGEWAMLRVIDDGVGMDEATQRRAFEPFYTTKDHGEGSGLGLSTVHGIVRGHGGFVEARSEPDGGTEVLVYLPLCEDGVSQPVHVLDTDGACRRVLVVRRDSVARRGIRELLRSTGLEVVVTDSPEAALRAVRAQGTSFHLWITTPAPGPEIAELAAELVNVPVLVLMGEAEYSEAGAWWSNSRVGRLREPVAQDRLLEQVADLLGVPVA